MSICITLIQCSFLSQRNTIFTVHIQFNSDSRVVFIGVWVPNVVLICERLQSNPNTDVISWVLVSYDDMFYIRLHITGWSGCTYCFPTSIVTGSNHNTTRTIDRCECYNWNLHSCYVQSYRKPLNWFCLPQKEKFQYCTPRTMLYAPLLYRGSLTEIHSGQQWVGYLWCFLNIFHKY
jgi:hypothetical protein